MNTLRILDRRAVYYALAIMLAIVSLLPVLASAAQVNERSIELSSSAKSATNVSYKVNFTSVASAGAFVVDFCSNSPLIGSACTAPAGFDASSAASTTSGFTDVTGSTSQVVVAGTIGAATTVSVDITGVTNPSAIGTLYARIVTYDNKTNAQAYDSAALGTGNVDNGGVALGITDKIGVSAAVLEAMTFCVSKNVPTENCGGTLEAPVLQLGEDVGGVKALTETALSKGTINTQLTTNATGGAVISLKSNALDCGGLIRAGAPSAADGCGIAPALATTFAAGTAKFGVKTATATATAGSSTAAGVLQPVSGQNYNNSGYALNYASGNATGVTSSYGDHFLDTNDAPVNNMNMALEFAASASSATPAGLYSADLSLIATGKF